MPVYEIVMQHPNGNQRVRHGEHAPTEIGDVLTFDGAAWVVIAKEPPFEQRRIERLVCTPRLILQYRRGTRLSTNWGEPPQTAVVSRDGVAGRNGNALDIPS
jgi:hypothetical protein